MMFQVGTSSFPLETHVPTGRPRKLSQKQKCLPLTKQSGIFIFFTSWLLLWQCASSNDGHFGPTCFSLTTQPPGYPVLISDIVVTKHKIILHQMLG